MKHRRRKPRKRPVRLLVVEDEPEIAAFLQRVLQDATWAADTVATASAALTEAAVTTYDLMIVDVGLPDMDGFDLCRALRATGNRVPVLMLTARQSVNDRVRGLDAGADDYLAKPFAVSELLARLRALSRRPAQLVEAVLHCDDLTLDPATRRVARRDEPITLTAREFALLEFFLRNQGRVYTRAQILEHVWDDHFDPVANAVDVLVGRLRRKIDRAGMPAILRTVRGAGYVLSGADPSAVKPRR